MKPKLSNEQSPLLAKASSSSEINADPDVKSTSAGSAALVVYATFLGEFLASADESLMTSNYTVVASEFQSLSKGSWLLVAYTFGYCVASPVIGVLADLFGRKKVLLWSYAFFTLGCIACGISVTMNQLILARGLTGLSGAELISPKDIVIYQNYTSMVNIAGRSLGAPIGGLLSQTVGWRWSFLGQLPLIGAASFITMYQMPQSLNNLPQGKEDDSVKSRLSSIDFPGIFVFATGVLSLLFALHNFELGDAQQSPLFYITGALFLTSTVALFLTEKFWAANPLIPLNLMMSTFGAYCLSQQLITMGRSAFIPTTTQYFIRVFNVSDFNASVVNMLIMIGVPVGGYFSGVLIRRAQKPKTIGIVAACFMGLVYLLIFVRWRAPCLPGEATYLIPFGFTMGILFSTQFVGMTSTISEASRGQCIGTYILFQQLGAIIGSVLGLKLLDHTFQRSLRSKLSSNADNIALVQHVLDNARFAFTLPQATQNIIRESYISGFQIVPLFCALCVFLALLVMVFSRGRRL